MRWVPLILALPLAALAQPGDVTALVHATVIDGTGAAAKPDTTVLIQGGKITAVYPSASRAVPAGAKVEDLTGKWIIPGLIDAHVHLANDSGDIAKYKELLGWLLAHGVTGVRDMAGDARILGYLAREAKLDAPGWPNIYYSALMAGPTFFFEDQRVPGASKGFTPGAAPFMRAMDETVDIRTAVAEAKGTGATGIKLYANLPASLVKAIAAEAHRQGLLVWAHGTVFPAKPSDLVDAGADVLSHTAYLAWQAAAHVPPDYSNRAQADFAHIRTDDPRIKALLDQMKEHGTILDATLTVFHGHATAEGLLPWIAEVTRAAHRAGIPVDAGTDAQRPPQDGASPAVVEEMSLLVKECGFTPIEAIQAATQVSAMTVGQGAQRGAITAGMAADLVVLSADPSVEVGNVKKVVEVRKDGRMFAGR